MQRVVTIDLLKTEPDDNQRQNYNCDTDFDRTGFIFWIACNSSLCPFNSTGKS